MNRILTLLLLTLGLASWVGAQSQPTADGLYAEFVTSKGTVEVQLDPSSAPMAVTLFVGLAEGTLNPTSPGTPYYQNQIFYAQTPGVVVQAGDPTGKGDTIVGGPVPTETGVSFDKPGVLGLFSLVPGKNGSLFFFSLDALPNLKGRFPGFGTVVSGLDVVKSLMKGDQLVSVTILRNGPGAQGFKADKPALDTLLQVEKDKEAAALAKASDGTSVTASGLRYKVLKAAPAVRKPRSGQTVTVDYKGTLLDGTVFDSSYNRPAPFQFEVGNKQVIPGWDEALVDMSVGEKRLLVVPPALGYGAKGMPPAIAPDTWLVFEVELLGIR